MTCDWAALHYTFPRSPDERSFNLRSKNDFIKKCSLETSLLNSSFLLHSANSFDEDRWCFVDGMSDREKFPSIPHWISATVISSSSSCFFLFFYPSYIIRLMYPQPTTIENNSLIITRVACLCLEFHWHTSNDQLTILPTRRVLETA